ncbi:MAG: flagellar hook-basal body complex protein [Tepidisphaera sp.]|nr:flagellar hook-basal body complex protein [Tepidisphaera sp.]
MPSTTALYTALTGLNAASRDIEVIGDNIANVNTTAYKSSRLEFSTIYSRTISAGTAPSANYGGANPFQIGLGVNTAGTLRNTNPGTISSTGDDRDLAIDGKGYFVVNRGTNQFFTRAGSFRTNADHQLTTISGERVQGYGVDSNFNIIPGRISDVNLPVGALTIAQATRNVQFSGNLNASGLLPSRGSTITLGAGTGVGFSALAGANPAPVSPNVLDATTRLVDISDIASPGGTTALFAAGQSISISGAQKGGKLIPTASYAITSASTVADISAFFTSALGINTTTGPNPDGSTPGVSLDPATGLLSIVGNTGTTNDLTIGASDVRLNDASGALIKYPFAPNKTAEADGESVRTTFTAYDSLGSTVELDITYALDSRSSTGTAWRYYIETTDPNGQQTQIATGTQLFDTKGQPLSTTPVTVNVDRTGSGADTPLTLALDFASPAGGLTALSDTGSSIAATYRDGSPIGTLTGYGIGGDGVITGVFTNGLTRTLGQLALATFNNQDGLVSNGDNLFSAGANSGTAIITQPGGFGTGGLVSGSLEQSNVDLSTEFIRLVQASTGFSASSRIIKTTDDLMQQLLVLGR